ncbi:MAG: UDP-N-acetylmuramoyl-L-alanyl-D-glutamate--2,6-diaminopimelate ligase [Solirubrobacteraceae bacterium]
MRLDEVISGVPVGARDIEITGLAYDNRTVEPGGLFFCVPGFTQDGHDFAHDAIARGAAALVVQRPLNLGVPEIVVDSVRATMAGVAAAFHGDPTGALQVVGITGTNGKTTTAFILRAMLEGDGRPCGLLGTVKSVIGGVEHPVLRTTPEALELQRDFRAMLAGGDVACAIEVSSHALELHRVDAIHFAAAIFTNLTQDHLDFHPTLEAYFEAKRRLFTTAQPKVAVVNVDDPHGVQLATELEHPVTFALERPATFRAQGVQTGIDGSRFQVQAPDGTFPLRSPLRGRFNVYNALGALAAAYALGVDLQTAAGALQRVVQVPGRLELVDEGQDFAVLVDYAHTPDSLENVLRTARALTRSRVHVVFGCGGDRDRAKRPLMGEIASRLADRVIVTSDNPRSEDPAAIIEQILAGARAGAQSIVDRGSAIAGAIAGARRGDVVVIAGKGHERGQELAAGRKIPFDDVLAARESLRDAAAPR